MYRELTMVASSCMDSFKSGWSTHIRAASLLGTCPLNSRYMQGFMQLFRLASSIRMVKVAAGNTEEEMREILI